MISAGDVAALLRAGLGEPDETRGVVAVPQALGLAVAHGDESRESEVGHDAPW